MNHLTLTDDLLVVEPVGLARLWSLRRRIEVPLGRVRGATYDPGAAHEAKGLRGPGLAIPGLRWAGTFHRDGERTFWNVRAGRPTLVVELDGTDLARLYLTVDDARAEVDRVNAAVARTRR